MISYLIKKLISVPMVLKCCTEFIESHGIVDGIYRLSGVTSNIQKLRYERFIIFTSNIETVKINLSIHT